MSPPEWFCTTYTGAKECKHARFSIYSVDNRISKSRIDSEYKRIGFKSDSSTYCYLISSSLSPECYSKEVRRC